MTTEIVTRQHMAIGYREAIRASLKMGELSKAEAAAELLQEGDLYRELTDPVGLPFVRFEDVLYSPAPHGLGLAPGTYERTSGGSSEAGSEISRMLADGLQTRGCSSAEIGSDGVELAGAEADE